MNLIDEPWIPVVDGEKKLSKIGLIELFQSAEKYTDLVLPVGQRIAIMRFLLALIYASHTGPQNFDDWRSIGQSFHVEVLSYLRRMKHRFELFDTDFPFMQIKGIKAFNGVLSPVEKLDMNLAAGSSQTLFDNQGGLRTHLPKDQIARTLITFQHFCLNGRTSKIEWEDFVSADSAKRSPMFGTIHSFLIGSDLRQTLYLNLLTLDDIQQTSWGSPSWEQNLNNHKEANSYNSTFMGSLLPWRRFIKLKETCDECACGSPTLDELFFSDPYLSVERNLEKNTLEYLGAKEGCELWRQIGAILFKKNSQDEKIRRPIHINQLKAKCQQQPFDIWLGCIHAYPGVNAKIVSIQESRYHFSNGWADDNAEHRDYFEKWLQMSEDICKKLKNKIERYYKHLYGDKKIPELIKSKKVQAEFLFWNRVTEHVSEFFKLDSHDLLNQWLSDWQKKAYVICSKIEQQFIQPFNSRSYQAWALSQKEK